MAFFAYSPFLFTTVQAAVFSPQSFSLDNGLKVVVIENHRAPIAMQMLWYRVGAADEEAGESGLAHFLEHLLFKGTKTIKPVLASVQTRVGEVRWTTKSSHFRISTSPCYTNSAWKQRLLEAAQKR